MFRQLRIATLMLALLTIVTGWLYPLVVTVFAQSFFSKQANGSLILADGKAVGSELIGQSFSQPGYFWGRLSATAPMPNNAASSGGSNFGPRHPDLKKAVEARIAALGSESTTNHDVPVDLATASASGLDPHISPAAAEFQIKRVAASRKMTESRVRELVRQHTEERQWGVFGLPRVNVLQLNLDLDRQQQAN